MVRSRLWLRLALTFVVASVLPVLGAGLLTIRLLDASVREDAHARELALADLAGTLVRDFIARGNEKITTVSRLLAEELTNRRADDEDYRRAVVSRLNHLVEPPDAYLALDLFATGGEFVGNASRIDFTNAQGPPESQMANQNARNVEHVQQSVVRDPLEHGRAFVAPRLEEAYGFPSLPISVPLTRGEKSVGAVVAYLDFRRVSALLGLVSQGEYRVRLLDGGQEVLAQAGGPTIDELVVTRPVGHSDWQIEVREPRARVLAAVQKAREQGLVWVGLAAALAIVLSLAITAWIVRPVAVLTRTARAVESGDLKARAGISRRDEIGELAQAFDRMTSALDQLDAAKSEFVANVSHELRTPLTAMRLSIANLRDGVLGPLEEPQKATLERLGGDVDRLVRMVNELLDMARLEAGVVQLRREPTDLLALAREVVAALEPLARAKGIDLVVEGTGQASADRSLLHRVLSNLVDNAVKFTPEGGRVTVALAGSTLRVTDSGPGVANPRLFEKFSQAPVDGVKPRGAGLGLAIVKKLVELHGGTVASLPGESGATFVVTL